MYTLYIYIYNLLEPCEASSLNKMCVVATNGRRHLPRRAAGLEGALGLAESFHGLFAALCLERSGSASRALVWGRGTHTYKRTQIRVYVYINIHAYVHIHVQMMYTYLYLCT